ncbi:uncharacterized protein B0H18DRAFT_1096075 [Fomitopsis serialis]|uniref:uncharacterized protein n=1 Tax=Fomitopsis serialis TaxID=139415 RepID=UPI002007995E|nr:uncharacterized protein B0H18DRAFT_1096075 [Neoantrodia serialis]KAH9919707.1 hypothetical protein B0H18DRAFT_1096075 [Neoantrodia serialis]
MSLSAPAAGQASSRPQPERPDIPRNPSFIQFTPKRAMASFENLVALANYEERLREARKIVWRDRGEKPVELHDLWECAEHAGRGGIRAGGLAFAIRAGVNLILLMTRIKRIPAQYRLTLIRHAAFGEDSFRFATMLGSFVAIYKFILNALPILLSPPSTSPILPSHTSAHNHSGFYASGPADSPFDDVEEVDLELQPRRRLPRQARLSMSAQAHQVWVRKRTRRWYSVLAGSAAGAISVCFEKKSRRVAIAQQMFVRGLQGSFNAFSQTHGVSIPHGDVLMFGLCCGQIMYAWLVRPETLDRGYDMWIATASKCLSETVAIARDLLRDGVFKVSDMQKLAARPDTTPANRTKLLAYIARATAPPPEQSFGPRYVPCAALHPWSDSHALTQIERFVDVFRWMLPIYGALHLMPMLLFRRNRVLSDPVNMLLRAGWGTARSSAFLGAFVFIYQSMFCVKHNLWDVLTALRTSSSTSLLAYLARLLPQRFIDALIAKKSYYALGILTGLSLFVEEKKRREELAMYVMPKGMESAWLMARGRGWVGRTGQWGEVLLTAVGMGMVMSIYQNDPQHLSGLVRKILYQFVGPN